MKFMKLLVLIAFCGAAGVATACPYDHSGDTLGKDAKQAALDKSADVNQQTASITPSQAPAAAQPDAG